MATAKDYKDQFKKKYYKEISGIANKQGVDEGTATNMFVKNIENVGNKDYTSYGGGGVRDMSEPAKDYQKMQSDISNLQSNGSGNRGSQYKSKTYDILSYNDAYAQADKQINPQIQQLKNELIRRISKARGNTTTNLAVRGQATGGQRALAEANLSSDESLQSTNIMLDGEIAKNQIANQLVEQSKAEALGLEATDYQRYLDSVNMARQRQADEIAQQQYADEIAWRTSQNNPDYVRAMMENEYLPRETEADIAYKEAMIRNLLAPKTSGSSRVSSGGEKPIKTRLTDSQIERSLKDEYGEDLTSNQKYEVLKRFNDQGLLSDEDFNKWVIYKEAQPPQQLTGTSGSITGTNIANAMVEELRDLSPQEQISTLQRLNESGRLTNDVTTAILRQLGLF